MRVLHWTHFHFLYAAPMLTAFDAAILTGVSRYRRGRVGASRGAAAWSANISRAARLPGVPLWQDYRVHAAALLALTAAVVMAFR